MFFSALLRPPLDDDGWKWAEPAYEPDRTWGVHAGEALVGTATSFPCRMAVPGGAVLDTAAVTQVGVRADHTRRGLLSALMRAQLDDVAVRGGRSPPCTRPRRGSTAGSATASPRGRSR